MPPPRQAGDLFLDSLSHLDGMKVDVQLPIEMVDLMLEASCRQSLALELDWFTVEVDTADEAMFEPTGRETQARYRKTRLVTTLPILADRANNRIHDTACHPIMEVEDEEPLQATDLIG